MSNPNQRTPLYYHDPTNPSYQSKDSYAKAGYSMSSGGHGSSQYGGSAASGNSAGQQGGGGQSSGNKNPAFFQGFMGGNSGGKK